jgi:DNA-binding transcriptional ArsR family regulator
MMRRKRVLVETLIILASALIVFLLIASSPSEAAGDVPENPPEGGESSNPVQDPIINDPAQVEQPSDDPSDDSSSQPVEQVGENSNEVEENANNPSERTQSQLPDIVTPGTFAASVPSVDSENPTEYDFSSNRPGDGSTQNEDSTDDSETDDDPSANYDEEGNEINKARLSNLLDFAFFLDEEDFSDGLNTFDPDEIDDATRKVLGPEDVECIGGAAWGMENSALNPIDKNTRTRNLQTSSAKRGPDKSVTSSFNFEVKKIKLSSHIDKLMGEPITKFLFGMYTKLDSTSDLRGVRKKIYEYIKAHPGEHMATLRKEFSLSPSSISHHINVLEKNGFILSHIDGRYKRLFVNNNGYISTVSDNYKSQISALKNVNSKKIVFYLMARPMSTQYELSEALELHPSTIHWHAKKLQALGLISAIKDGKNIRYTVEDSSGILKVLGVVETAKV